MAEPKSLLYRGCRLSYTVTGEGPPVLFIQGVAVQGDGWLPQIEGLARDHRCLSFDNRGMGRSQPCAERLTVGELADDALALMDAEGWDSAHVVGHSLGGAIALEVALRAPARVRTLSLLCTFSRGRDATRLSGRMLWLGMRSRIGSARMRRHAFLQIVMPPEVLAREDRDALAAKLEPLFGHDLAEQPPVTMKQLAAMRNYDATPRLGELADIPTVVVAAVHDPIAPPEIGRALAAGIRGARYVEYDDAAHGVTIQHADRINALLREHFESAPELRVEHSP